MYRTRAYASKPVGPYPTACHHGAPEAPSHCPSEVLRAQVIATRTTVRPGSSTLPGDGLRGGRNPQAV